MRRPQRLQRQAVKAGLKASRKRDHVVSTDELLELSIQVMPAFLRVLLFTTGLALFGFALSGWPTEELWIRIGEGLLGLLLALFGILGVRQTVEAALEGVGDAGALLRRTRAAAAIAEAGLLVYIAANERAR